jgi:hypothetical protein
MTATFLILFGIFSMITPATMMGTQNLSHLTFRQIFMIRNMILAGIGLVWLGLALGLI